MDHEVDPCQMAFFHGHTFMVLMIGENQQLVTNELAEFKK